MGKETDSDCSRKRKKSTGGSVVMSMQDGDIYKVIISCEEKEAVERFSEHDSESFLSICEIIRKAMSNIAKLKSVIGENAKDEAHELQIQTSLAFIELKKLNRMEKFRMKNARDSLVLAKSSVDSRHLHLQNLLYEVMHLKKEVMKCLQFKSKDENIELVSEEEFYKDAVGNNPRLEVIKNNSHQLRLARLEWELIQRKQLAALCNELTNSKRGVALSIKFKQTRLNNLTPQLRLVLETSKPLQESLDLPLDKFRQEYQKAALLASPLYVLYVKASAYRDAYDPSLIVSVEGDENDAKHINSQDGLQESDSDMEIQPENIVEETLVHKKRHYRLSKEARQEEKKSRLLERHPLSVKIIIVLKNWLLLYRLYCVYLFTDETRLTLQFFYTTYFKVVTLESQLDTKHLKGISSGDMLVSESILRELYAGDLGIESPNPANRYQLLRYNLGSFCSLGLGISYRWAQQIAGLHFISPNISKQKVQKICTNQKFSENSIECVLEEIKRRVKARLELCTEIHQLETGNLPILTDNIAQFPHKIATNLCSYSTLTWKSYSCYPDAPLFCQQGLVSSIDIFYEAILRRGSDELIARIAIKPNHPRVAPVFSIGVNLTIPALMDTLRDIEREINVMWEKPPTLSAQVQRLRACFDIYLETENLASREKVFFHTVRGRTRSRPYKYLTLGGGIFIHR